MLKERQQLSYALQTNMERTNGHYKAAPATAASAAVTILVDVMKVIVGGGVGVATTKAMAVALSNSGKVLQDC